MRYIAMILLALQCVAQPVTAQDEDTPSMMERGAQQFLEGLLLEMEPAFDGMRGFMDEMGPALTDLMGQIEDWSVYEAPEILDNGDIIIRRKPDKPARTKEPPQVDL